MKSKTTDTLMAGVDAFVGVSGQILALPLAAVTVGGKWTGATITLIGGAILKGSDFLEAEALRPMQSASKLRYDRGIKYFKDRQAEAHQARLDEYTESVKATTPEPAPPAPVGQPLTAPGGDMEIVLG